MLPSETTPRPPLYEPLRVTAKLRDKRYLSHLCWSVHELMCLGPRSGLGSKKVTRNFHSQMVKVDFKTSLQGSEGNKHPKALNKLLKMPSHATHSSPFSPASVSYQMHEGLSWDLAPWACSWFVFWGLLFGFTLLPVKKSVVSTTCKASRRAYLSTACVLRALWHVTSPQKQKPGFLPQISVLYMYIVKCASCTEASAQAQHPHQKDSRSSYFHSS